MKWKVPVNLSSISDPDKPLKSFILDQQSMSIELNTKDPIKVNMRFLGHFIYLVYLVYFLIVYMPVSILSNPIHPTSIYRSTLDLWVSIALSTVNRCWML